MSLAIDFARGFLPADKQADRLSQLLVYLSLSTMVASIVAAGLTYSYGYTAQAWLILMASATFPLAIVVMHMFKSPIVAGHYLAANIMLQSILFAPDPAISCVVLISMAAGAGLLGTLGSRIWLSLIVLRCIYVAFTVEGTDPSATAAVSAFISVVVFAIVQLSELSRARSDRRTRERQSFSQKQASILQSLITRYFDGVMQVRGDDVFAVSDGIEKLLGYKPDNFIDRPLSYYLHPEEQDLLEHLTPDKPPVRMEVRLRHADGRWVWVELYATSGLLFGANPNHVQLVLRDYEKERKVGDQLTQAQRLEGMGSMAAAVAHDFNNMLTVIMGISDELPEGTPRREIRRVTTNAANLTNKLLTFGHGQPPSSEIHDLSHLMSEHSLLMQHTLDSRYVVIESYIDDPLLVRINESQFEQILVNLVNNARESMPDGGELEISLQWVEFESEAEGDKSGHYALLEVGDSGRGIDAETQAKIFDPFFSTKDTLSNSGLGLSSCYGIVSQYGGFIEIDSKVGVGTTVKVYLPIAETRDYQPTLDVIDNEVSIMVIDDDPGVVRVVRNALQRAGYYVRGFTDVSAAREAFSPSTVSLVIADVVMPGITGANLVNELRLRAPDLPVLFISGFTNDALNDWTPDKQTNYLAKPFRAEEVVARVGELLGSKRLREANANL
ncbi:MAG: ATP-binding protein [Pseudomonadaceae bacterium]|nr:ATP-binding protein [Pseudomonadaceae bacterium]